MSFWLADVNFFENRPLSLRLIKKELYFLRTETFRRNTCKKENSEFKQEDAYFKNDIIQQLIKITACLYYQHQTNIFHTKSLDRT